MTGPPRPVLVSLVNVDRPTTKALEVFFSSTCKGRWQVDSRGAGASLVIVDLDDGNPSELLRAQRRTADLPIVALSTAQQVDERITELVAKPIDLGQLRRALERAGREAAARSSVDPTEERRSWNPDQLPGQRARRWERAQGGAGPTSPEELAEHKWSPDSSPAPSRPAPRWKRSAEEPRTSSRRWAVDR